MKLKHSLDGQHTLDGRVLKKEFEDGLRETRRLHELGVKFESDKAKLEAEIDKVRNSSISETNKGKLIRELESAIEKLQEQYDEDVTEEAKEQQEKLQEKINDMQVAADKLAEQAESLRNLEMEASSTDASAAADEADAQKQEFEDMKAEHVEKLQLQIQQAEIQRRAIRARRLSGQ